METPDDVNAQTRMSAAGSTPADRSGSDGDVQQLKVEISETQAELQQTVAEIQERLTPSHLKEQAAGAVRDATLGRMQHMMNRAGDTLSGAADTTRRAASRISGGMGSNPMPIALIAIGAAWLLANNRSSRRYSSGADWDDDESWQSATGEYAGASAMDDTTGYGSSDYSTGSYSTGASTSYGQGGSDPSRWRGGSTDRARRAMSRARSGWDSMLHDNPVAMGIAALAAGALVGAAIPSTDVENRYMGEARDTVLESARDMAHQTVEKVTGAQTP